MIGGASRATLRRIQNAPKARPSTAETAAAATSNPMLRGLLRRRAVGHGRPAYAGRTRKLLAAAPFGVCVRRAIGGRTATACVRSRSFSTAAPRAAAAGAGSALGRSGSRACAWRARVHGRTAWRRRGAVDTAGLPRLRRGAEACVAAAGAGIAAAGVAAGGGTGVGAGAGAGGAGGTGAAGVPGRGGRNRSGSR
jgi:hypothetical protein